jgi:hypothetical protein
MSLVDAVKGSIGAQIALKIGALLVLLMAIGSAVVVHQFTSRLQESAIENAKVTVRLAARQYGDMFDAAIDAGQLTVADVFDTDYQEIKGWDWKGQSKYHTRYDAFTDRAALVFQDRILETADYHYAMGLDVNGYVPTHNTRAQKPLVGEQDLAENRTKRKYLSNTAEVSRARSTEPFLLQPYTTDTGEALWDASAPIYVKGKHWGAFVLGVSLQTLQARKRELALALLGVLAGATAITLCAVYLLVRQAIRPVVELTDAANQISIGEALETPLVSDSPDEIGLLTRSLERLRASMLAAMKRLG